MEDDVGVSMRNRLKVLIVLFLLMISGCSGVPAGQPQAQNSAVVVYYFHRTIRCPSCTLLEEITHETVEFGFGKEMDSGRICMTVINLDEKANEHFVNDYNLSAQSVVVSEVKNGKEQRWKNLDQVWTLIGDEGQLREYIQKEIKGYLKD